MKDKDMVGGCCVCSDELGWTENPLVYCDGQGCNIAVHQACYGIVKVPVGSWFCRKCSSQEKSAKVRCELCPSSDGALKRTDNSGWAHVICALYIPEVRFGNVTAMEPIILQLVPQERYNKSCYMCEEQGKQTKAGIGACMQCNKSGCKQNFHVTCAQAAGLLCEEAGNNHDNVKYTGYCHHHYQKLKKTSSIKTIPAFKPVPSRTPDSSSEKNGDKTKGRGGDKSGCSNTTSPNVKQDSNKNKELDSSDAVTAPSVEVRKGKRPKLSSTSSTSTASDPVSELGEEIHDDNLNEKAENLQAPSTSSEDGAINNDLGNEIIPCKRIRLAALERKKKRKHKRMGNLRKIKSEKNEDMSSDQIPSLNNQNDKKNNAKKGGLVFSMEENTHVIKNEENPKPLLEQQVETAKPENAAEEPDTNVTASSALLAQALIGSSAPQFSFTFSSRNSSSGNQNPPQTMEQLLEHQWEQGSNFLMECARNFDVAHLLISLRELCQNTRDLQDHVNNLTSRRDHLLAVNARLSLPLSSHTFK